MARQTKRKWLIDLFKITITTQHGLTCYEATDEGRKLDADKRLKESDGSMVKAIDARIAEIIKAKSDAEFCDRDCIDDCDENCNVELNKIKLDINVTL